LKRRESNCCNEIEREGTFNNTKKKKRDGRGKITSKNHGEQRNASTTTTTTTTTTNPLIPNKLDKLEIKSNQKAIKHRYFKII
jgi:hypothetical protein